MFVNSSNYIQRDTFYSVLSIISQYSTLMEAIPITYANVFVINFVRYRTPNLDSPSRKTFIDKLTLLTKNWRFSFNICLLIWINSFEQTLQTYRLHNSWSDWGFGESLKSNIVKNTFPCEALGDAAKTWRYFKWTFTSYTSFYINIPWERHCAVFSSNKKTFNAKCQFQRWEFVEKNGIKQKAKVSK